MRRFVCLFLLAAPLLAETTPVPWDMAKLEAPPAYRWLSQEGPIHSLLYAGETYQGKPTEVFAYCTPPQAKTEGAKRPGVVLIHGGGGTAFADWVWLWQQRGYAAIAMDLGGHQPQGIEWIEKDGVRMPAHFSKQDTRTRLPNGGPNQGHAEKFDSIASGDVHDHWPFHAVANVIRAHSLLRSLPDVDPERIAVTGISWGGYTTCLVASVDHRFQAAVPVYGCGFLFEGESVQKAAIDRLGDQRSEWIRRYDPSGHLPNCRIPILFVNGTNDIHYPLDSYQRSFEAVPHDKKRMRIEPRMRHSHPAGWEPAEIGLFIDANCKNGHPLPEPGTLTVGAEQVELSYTSAIPLKKAQLHVTTNDGPRSKREWHSLDATFSATTITAPKPAPEVNTWFITLTDERGAMVSTPVQFSDR